MKHHYVYVHRRTTDGKVFYVGQGVRKRAWSKSGRNRHWLRTVTKHGYTVHQVFIGLQFECALSMERALIAFYGRENLTNLTDGGDIGPTGLVHTEAVRRAQSERLTGNTLTLGTKLTDGHKAKISAALTGRVVSEETRTKLRARGCSPETRAKLSQAMKGRVMRPEWVEKISSSLRGRKASPEARANQSAAQKGKRTGKDNPSFGIPKTEAQKAVLSAAMTGRKFAPETIAKRSGENHPRYDAGEYTMSHPEYGVLTAPRHYFMDTYQIDSSKFSALIKGTRRSCRGWSMVSLTASPA